MLYGIPYFQGDLADYIIKYDSSINLFYLSFLIYIPLLWFIVAQNTKRCHDRGNSGYYQFIPFYCLWLIFGDGENGSNQYGEDPWNDQINDFLSRQAKYKENGDNKRIETNNTINRDKSISNKLDISELNVVQNVDANENYEEDDIVTLEQWEKQDELYREELAYKSFESTKPDYKDYYEKHLIERFKNIMINNFASNKEQELNQLIKDIFEYCLVKSNKDVKFEEISNVNIADILNNSSKIHYAPIYASFKKTMQSVPENVKKNNVQNSFQSASYMFNELTNLVISQINKI